MSDLTPNHKAGEPLAPIDGESLQAMANKNTENPEGGKKVIRTHTEADGQFRNYTQVRDLKPTLVSEPPKLLGDDSAPNPTEIDAGRSSSLHLRRYPGGCNPPWDHIDQDQHRHRV